MNHEILFRGKRTDNGEWIEGSAAKSGGMFIICDNGLTYGGFKVFEVIPETVGQFTGLTDKNGVKIFEGDVVRCYSREDVASCVVIFEKGEYHLVPVKWYKDYQECCGYYAIRCFDKIVIGNIHDNPELLGG